MSLGAEEEHRKGAFDWTLWLKWVLVSTLGWGISMAVGAQFLIGTIVGLLQWLVLRSQFRGHGWWIPASAGGWAGAAGLITLILKPESAGGLAGMITPFLLGTGIGLGQWLVLRGQVQRAWWWIVVSALGWTVGLLDVLGVSLTGSVAGAATGLGLELLLRHPRPHAQGEGTAR